jgi:hypothetical protein
MEVILANWAQIRDIIGTILVPFIYEQDGLQIAKSNDLYALKRLSIINMRPAVYAVYYGRLGMVKWLYQKLSGKSFDKSFDKLNDDSSRENHIFDFDVRYLLHKLKLYDAECHCRLIDATKLIDLAAWNGHLNVVRWMFKKNLRLSCHAIIMSAHLGRLDILRWIHRYVTDMLWIESVVDVAADSGDLKMIKWLTSKGITHDTAINTAANAGHLNIVKWMYENMKCVFEPETLYHAAKHGHLAIVKWLLERREQNRWYYIFDAINKAVKHDRLDIARLLLRKFPNIEINVKETKNIAKKYGCFAIYEELSNRK